MKNPEFIFSNADSSKDFHEPRYDLKGNEVLALEQDMVQDALNTFPERGLVSMWISPFSKYANYVRMQERVYFPEVEEVSPEDEASTSFYALIDTREDAIRVVHAAALTGVMIESDKDSIRIDTNLSSDQTGFFTIDELIDRGNFSAEEFYQHYGSQGVELDKSIAVETNFRIGEKCEKYAGFGTAELAYLDFFQVLERNGVNIGRSVVFATINHASISSFDRVGLRYEPLMGRTDMKTPEAELGKESLPVAIYYDDHSSFLFKAMGIELPKMFI